jgi:hypothetical protein
LGHQHKRRQKDGLYRCDHGQHYRGIEVPQCGPWEIDHNPRAEDEKMKVHKTQALRDAGHALGKLILPASPMVIGVASLEPRSDMALDNPGELDRRLLN